MRGTRPCICSLCGAPEPFGGAFETRRRKVLKDFGIYLEDLPGTAALFAGAVCSPCLTTCCFLFTFDRKQWQASL